MTKRTSARAFLCCTLLLSSGAGCAGSDAGSADGAISDSGGGDGARPDSRAPDGAAPDGPMADGSTADGGGSFTGTIFDMPMIQDAATASCAFTNRRDATKDGISLDLFDVSYTSWESIDGSLMPITIRGFAAKPRGALGPMPGVVQAHGLGGHASEGNATGPAALLGMFVLAFTGPGGGDPADPATAVSEGRPSGFDSGRRMFDTIPDPRGSWFWGHAVAAMRGLTCLETRAEVDPARLGMTGYSAGGVVTLISSGVDDRIVASVPLSASLRWEVATQAPGAWQHALLRAAGYDTNSSHWLQLVEMLDAGTLLGSTNTAIWMVNGTSDEFFPMTAHMGTYDAFAHEERRLSFVANGDHGCLLAAGVPGVDRAADIQARADLRARGAQRAWFHHHFGTDADYSCVPAEPTLTIAPGTGVTMSVDTRCSAFDVEAVKVWYSGDGGFTYIAADLNSLGGGSYGAFVALAADALLVGDVQYVEAAFSLTPARFSVSSRPNLPAGFVPDIPCVIP
ncbi:MAG: acetylxylan esterase [Myxococcales bacterium]|nr:acetylxylan esterase [Myxococcales bacterium]